MNRLINTSLCLLILLLSSAYGIAQINPQFKPIPSRYNINSPNPSYALNINYDNIAPNRQVFHLFLPDTEGNFPLVVYIHGGGFTGGSPSTVIQDPSKRADIKYYLERGIAYASFGYRLIASNQADNEGVIKCLNDSKRALQFVRYYADALNIDPERIVLTGGSAGAGTSLWLGTRDDMADLSAADPVLRESTRPCAVVMGGSQSTYDLYKWETQVYHNFDGQGTNYTLDSIVNLLGYQRASNFYGGLDSIRQILHDPALIQYREDVDMLFHMSSDDPPIYFTNKSQAVHPSQDLFHHSFHGREINEAALAANISEVKAFIPALSINTTNGESERQFVVRHLNACAQSGENRQVSEDSQSTPTLQSLSDIAIDVFPNPAREQITINLSGESIRDIALYSISGQLMSRQSGELSDTLTMPVHLFVPGIYFLTVTNQAGVQRTRKVIIE
ncbi:MAG: T9SS type A sorting domain-containing protein [Bacteroidota bacterium]